MAVTDKTRNPSHPMQPIVLDERGVVRFKQNAIVRYVLDNGGIDLNHIAHQRFSNDDHMQFAQLIGYSVSGYGDLSYSSSESVAAADRAVDDLLNGGSAEIEAEAERLKAENERLRGILRQMYTLTEQAIGNEL